MLSSSFFLYLYSHKAWWILIVLEFYMLDIHQGISRTQRTITEMLIFSIKTIHLSNLFTYSLYMVQNSIANIPWELKDKYINATTDKFTLQTIWNPRGFSIQPEHTHKKNPEFIGLVLVLVKQNGMNMNLQTFCNFPHYIY